jgi:2-methylisocitrate lyase-like PEP mutase family enzyme
VGNRLEHIGADAGQHGETGRTPYLTTRRLGELGFAVAIHPGTVFLAATFAVRQAMAQLRRDGRIEDLSQLATLEEYHRILHFPQYAARESRFGERSVDAVDAG